MIKSFIVLIQLCLCISVLAQVQPPRLVLPVGHTQDIISGVFSPDGSQVLTASFDHTAKVWDVRTGRLLLDLTGHTKELNAASYNLSGDKILTVSDDKTAKLWDATTGKMLFDFKHAQSLTCASFSPDNKKIVTNGGRIWDIKSGQMLAVLAYAHDDLMDVVFSHNGKYILASAGNNAMQFDALNGKLIKTFIGHKAYIVSVSFSPDDKKIITASEDFTAKVWNVLSGSIIFNLAGHTKKVNTAAFSPDGKKIVTASDDYTAHIWDAETGKLVFTLHDGKNPLNSAGFSPDGAQVLTVPKYGEPCIWNVPDGTLARKIKVGFTGLQSAVYDPSGDHILVIYGKLDGCIVDSKTGNILTRLLGHTSFSSFAAYLPNTDRIVSIGPGSSKIWNAHDLTLQTTFYRDYDAEPAIGYDCSEMLNIRDRQKVELVDVRSGLVVKEYGGYHDQIFSAVFSNDQKLVLTSSWDHTVRIWDKKSGNLISAFDTVYYYNVRNAIFSPDAGNIIITDNQGAVRVMNAKSGELVFNLEGHYSRVHIMNYSPDGKKLMTVSWDGDALIWDTENYRLLFKLKGHNNSHISSAMFSPDGKQILTAAMDNTAKIWDAASGALLYVMNGHKRGLLFSAYSPPCPDDSVGGRFVVTASEDNTAKIWDAGTGKIKASLDKHNNYVFSAMFSPDGKNIITTSSDNSINIWSAQSGKLLVRLLGIDDTDYINYIPSGYYKCSPGAAKYLHYVTPDLKIITFEQLDVKYNRPDKVLEAIGNADTALIKSYRKAYEKRIRKLGIDTTAFRDGYSIPEAGFAGMDTIAYEQKNENIRLHIHGKDNGFILDRFNLWVNEVPVYGQRGIILRDKLLNVFDTAITIRLSQGENRLETSITNVNGTESYRIPLIVGYSPDKRQKETTLFVGIGIDRFADTRYNLQYSAKDIRDLAKKLKGKYGSNIIIDTLFNEDVTVENIKALKKMLLRTSENDKVIIAYSGHGLLSKEYDYYLSTYLVDFEKPEQNGLPYDELENLLDSIPARKKLMLIDACHSGEVDKDEVFSMNKMAVSLGLTKGSVMINEQPEAKFGMKNSFELMQSLFVNVGKSTGATIISAAAGNQFALERGDLKNGVFTYSILEAMANNPALKISELKKIVGDRVEQLTNGMQKPTSRNETINSDWQVW